MYDTTPGSCTGDYESSALLGCGRGFHRGARSARTAFSKSRAALLASDAGRWALFVQPADRRHRPEFVGCFDIEAEACAAGFQSQIGRRFLVKAVLEEDPVISVPVGGSG